MLPSVDKTKCVGCGNCLRVCPARAIKLKEGKAEVDPSLCQGCLLCLAHCPTGAIEAREAKKRTASPISYREGKGETYELSWELNEIRMRLEGIKRRLALLSQRRR